MSGYLYSNEALIAAIKAANGLIYVAAESVGCNPQTIYNRAKRVKSVQQAIDSARGRFVDLAEQKLRQAVEDREPWAVSLVVSTLGKDRGYVKRDEIAGVPGQPIEFVEVPRPEPKRE